MANVIIIGSGPAGVSASLYTARAGKETLVISKGSGALTRANKIENYYGFKKAIGGAQLEKQAIEGAKNVGVKFIESEVLSITLDERFTVETTVGEFTADAVVLAAGASRAMPAIDGLSEFEGRGVSLCAVCDAFFFRGKNVCVLGEGEHALHEANVLSNVVESVTILTNKKKPNADFPSEYKIIEKGVSRVEGETRVKSVVFDDGSVVETDGIFVASGAAGSTALARKTGAFVNDKGVIVNEAMATNVPGLFAAGDCTGGLLQIAKAVYEGAQAGLSAVKHLNKG